MNERPKDLAERWFLAWSRGVRRRARLIVWLTPLLTGGLALYTARTLGVNTDTSSLVSDDLEYRRVFKAFQNAFPGRADEIVVVIEGVTPGIADRAVRELAAELVTDTVAFASVYAAGSDPFFDQHSLLYLDVDSLRALRDRLEGSSLLLRDLDARPTLDGLADGLGDAVGGSGDMAPILGLLTATAFAASEGRFAPVPWSVLVTGRVPEPRDRRRILTLYPRLDFDNAVPGREALERVRGAARRLGLTEREGVRIRLTGSIAIEAEELVSAVSGARRAGLLALVSVAVILFLGLRSGRLIFATLATLTVGLIGTSAFAAVAVGTLNLISVAFAVLYIGLGIDYGIHLSLRYRARMAGGSSPDDAIDAAVSEVGPALALSALTTAACFYAFIPTDFTGVSELGLIGGTGMFVSFLVTLTLLPALLAVFPLRSVSGAQRSLRGGLPGLGAFVQKWRRPILGATALVTVVALALVPGIRFDYNPLNLRDKGSESVIAYRALLADPVARPLTISVLRADSAAIAEVDDAVGPLDVVDGTRSIFDFVPPDQTPKLAILADLGRLLGEGGKTASVASDSGPAHLRDALNAYRWRGTPEERTAALRLFHVLGGWERRVEGWPEAERGAQTRALEAAFLGALTDQIGRLRAAAAARPVTLESLPRDLRDRWVGKDGRYRIEILPSEPLVTNERLWSFVDGVRDVIPDATGQAVTELEAGRVASSAFRMGLLWASLATVILLLALLRNPRAVALVVGPLLLAATWTAGLMSYFDLPFNFANVIGLPLLLGIGVDNGIHMVHHALGERPGESGPMAASTSRAILFATLTTMASFGNLAFAPHVGMASMGKLLTIGMTCVLFATLIVLPALLEAPGWISWVRRASPKESR